MITVKEEGVFPCEKCGKEWKMSYMMHGHGETVFVCGNEKKAELVPDWSGCGHVNKIKVER